MSVSETIPLPIMAVATAATLRLKMLRGRRGLAQKVCKPGPKSADWAYHVLSQNGEDGIIAVILDKIGAGNGKFVEFGFGYRESNMIAHALSSGASGLFLDGGETNTAIARAALRLLGRSDVKICKAWLERQNIDALIVEALGTGEVDVLSVDVDGADYWLLEAITSIEPKLLIVEYNSSYGMERAVSVPYDRAFDRYAYHPSAMCYGASLRAFTNLANRRGMALVGCEPTEPNAFFVRRELLQNGLVELSVEEAFTPTSDLRRRGFSQADQEALVYSMPVVDV